LNIPARREEGGEELLPVLSDEIEFFQPSFSSELRLIDFNPPKISNTTAKKNLTNSNFILLFFKFWRRLIYDSAMGYYLRIYFFLPINISLDIVAGASWRMSRVYNSSTGVIIFGQELLLLGRCVY
jgi:hypothetical protein